MNDNPKFVKETLLNIVRSMDNDKSRFVRNPEKDFTRRRTLDFQTMIKFILSAGSNTLATEIMNFFDFSRFPSVSAFVQQRKKILPEAFYHLLIEFNRQMPVSPKLFRGYRLLAVDGSDLTLPFNPDEPENIRTKDHCNFMHLNTVYDVCSRLYLDAYFFSGSKGGEASAAADMIRKLPEKYPVILLADRGYENYNLFANMEERLFDYVVRIKDTDSTGIMSGINLPDTQEFDVEKRIVITRHSTGPAAVMPQTYKYLNRSARFDFIENSKAPDYDITIRFVRFQLDNGQFEVLATSLPKETFSAEDLKEMYHLRWNIETAYLLSKWAMGMASYHSRKADSIMQEIYAELVMYNFVMYICMDLNIEGRGRKHPQQIKFTQAIKICLHFFKHTQTMQTYDVEATILKFLLPVRCNRSYPRKVVSPSVVGFNYRLA